MWDCVIYKYSIGTLTEKAPYLRYTSIWVLQLRKRVFFLENNEINQRFYSYLFIWSYKFKGLRYLLHCSTTSNIKKICWSASMKFNYIHCSHCQTSSVHLSERGVGRKTKGEDKKESQLSKALVLSFQYWMSKTYPGIQCFRLILCNWDLLLLHPCLSDLPGSSPAGRRFSADDKPNCYQNLSLRPYTSLGRQTNFV